MILKERILYSKRRTRRYHRKEPSADKKKKMYRFLAALWGVLSAGILLFGYVAGARSRHITMNGPVHILLEEEEEQTENIEVKPGEQIEKSAWITVEKSEEKVQVDRAVHGHDADAEVAGQVGWAGVGVVGAAGNIAVDGLGQDTSV